MGVVTPNKEWQAINEAMMANDLGKAIFFVNGVIKELRQTGSIAALKTKLNSIKEEELLAILRALDAGLMNQYSNFLIRYMYQKNRSKLSEILYYGDACGGSKVFDGEEKLRTLIQEEGDTLSIPLQKAAYRAWFYLLIDMKRLQEAKKVLEAYETLEDGTVIDRWGYFYFCSGQWEKAEQLLKQAISEQINPHYCALTLQSLYTAQGLIPEALNIINEGMDEHPYFLPFYLEKINKLKVLGRWEEVHETMKELDALAPYHVFQKYFIFSRGQSLYEKSDVAAFQQFIEDNKIVFKGTPYGSCSTIVIENRCQLPTHVSVQKYNYCGPTTVSMVLSRYGVHQSQDEIADKIFHINGSKTLSMITHLQELGMECQFFFGNKERFQELTDKGVSIILCVDYTSSSHVQLLKGYDNNLQAYYIQDPNNAETLVMSYEEFEKYYSNNQYQSIAVIPQEQKEKLDCLSISEHELVNHMYQLGDELEMNYQAREPFLDCVRKHRDSLFAASFAIKMIGSEEESSLLDELIQFTLEQHPELDYFKLIGAGALVKLKKYEEARILLETVKVKNCLDYFYLNGRIAFENYRYQEAIAYFREALNVEPDHYHSWSYIGLSYLNMGDMDTALYYSNASTDINNYDDWNRLNHGIILSDMQNFQEARIVFIDILKDFKNHVPSWIERARCDVALHRFHQAIRGLKTAKALMPDLPSPYLELANIYWNSDDKLAVEELMTGLEQTGRHYSLLIRLGEIAEDQANFAKAKAWYEEAWETSPNESYPFLSISRVITEISGIREGLEHLLTGEKSFSGDPHFLINGGKWLFNKGDTEDLKELALTWMETGMELADSNEPEAWDIYVSLVEDSPYLQRGRCFFTKLLQEKHPNNIEIITYIGYLFERENNMDEAKQYYESALQVGAHTFPYYRLGEVAFGFHHLDEAKEWYKKMFQLEPTMTAPLLKLAEIANMEGNIIQEHDYLFQVMKLCPFDVNMAHFCQLSNETGKLKDVENYLLDNAETLDESWRYHALAQCAGVIGNLDQEEAYLLQGLKQDPDHFYLQESLALLKLKQGKFSDVVSLLEKLIPLDVEYRPLYAIVADAFLEWGTLKSLIKFLQSMEVTTEEKSYLFMYTAFEVEQGLWEMVETGSIEKKQMKLLYYWIEELYGGSLRWNKSNDTAFVWLMEFCNKRDGMLDYAIRQCTKRLKKQWSFEIGFYVSQLIINKYVEQEHRKKAGEYGRAEAILLECLEEEPDHPGVHYALGRLYNELGTVDEAEMSLLRAITIDQRDPDIYYETSRLYEKLGELGKAEEMVRKCLELQPTFLLAHNQLSILLHQQGNTLEALRVIDELIGMEEENALAHYNKACYLTVLNEDPLTAIKHLTIAIENDEGDYLKELGKTDPDLQGLWDSEATARKMKQLLC